MCARIYDQSANTQQLIWLSYKHHNTTTVPPPLYHTIAPHHRKEQTRTADLLNVRCNELPAMTVTKRCHARPHRYIPLVGCWSREKRTNTYSCHCRTVPLPVFDTSERSCHFTPSKKKGASFEPWVKPGAALGKPWMPRRTMNTHTSTEFQ